MACTVTMSKNVGLSSQIVSNEGANVKWLRLVRAAACLAALLLSASARATPFDPSGTDWEGYADFVRLVRSEAGSPRVVVAQRLDWESLQPGDALILVYPDHGIDTASAGAFVRAGGRLALIDDFGAGDGLLTSFDVQRVPLPAHPALALRDNPDLPIADPGVDDQLLTQGVDHVVTNHATGLRQPLLRTVLRVRAADGTEVPLALSGASGEGRLLAIGDPSIAMNSMLRYPGNRQLAKNVVSYLTEGRQGGRVYVIVGEFTEAGSFAGAGGGGRAWLSALERMGESLTREGLPAWVLYWLSFVVTILLMVWLLPRAARTYKGEPPRFTRPTPLEAQGGAAGHAAALGAKQAYRGHAMLEWRRALVEDLGAHLALPVDSSGAEVVKRLAKLGALDVEALRAVERLLLRMAEIDTMIAARKTHALERIGDDEVVAAGALVQRVLLVAHQHAERTA